MLCGYFGCESPLIEFSLRIDDDIIFVFRSVSGQTENRFESKMRFVIAIARTFGETARTTNKAADKKERFRVK